jgi:hypothetical protein
MRLRSLKKRFFCPKGCLVPESKAFALRVFDAEKLSTYREFHREVLRQLGHLIIEPWNFSQRWPEKFEESKLVTDPLQCGIANALFESRPFGDESIIRIEEKWHGILPPEMHREQFFDRWIQVMVCENETT